MVGDDPLQDYQLCGGEFIVTRLRGFVKPASTLLGLPAQGEVINPQVEPLGVVPAHRQEPPEVWEIFVQGVPDLFGVFIDVLRQLVGFFRVNLAQDLQGFADLLGIHRGGVISAPLMAVGSIPLAWPIMIRCRRGGR